MNTEAEVGYKDAMRQVTRAMHHRIKALQEQGQDADERVKDEIRLRIREIEHLLQVVESLHR